MTWHARAGDREDRPEIPDKLYFRIGEVSRLAGIKPYVLRFWETEFSSLGPRNPARGTVCIAARTWSWCSKSSASCTTSAIPLKGARKFLDSRSREVVSKPARLRKSTRPQPALFSDTGPALDVIRKELTEILQLLSLGSRLLNFFSRSYSPGRADKQSGRMHDPANAHQSGSVSSELGPYRTHRGDAGHRDCADHRSEADRHGVR